ncbi:hypothetical protein J2R62_17765 [Plesiomonas shigelloides]|uniref:Uncharacterized protein n=1 Tax=Plesiomonas shigelloides TaxID=703 RepID=A0A8I2B6T1_PLESH|nr:hypothetical protein [Plesiomonas shigelloides]MBO1109993.1 hypothetical protein [Plesiomonas shigelloides]
MLSANGQRLLLRTIPPVKCETANAWGSSGESAPEKSLSTAFAGIPAGQEKSPIDEQNALLAELLPTAKNYADKLSEFHGGRWKQSNRSIPPNQFTYSTLTQLLCSLTDH